MNMYIMYIKANMCIYYNTNVPSLCTAVDNVNIMYK